jgi:hypothetical protein
MQSSSSSSLFINIPTLTNTPTTTVTTKTTSSLPSNSNIFSSTTTTTTNSLYNLPSTYSTSESPKNQQQQIYDKFNSIQPTVIILSGNNLNSTSTNGTSFSHNTATKLDLTKVIPLAATTTTNQSTQIKQVNFGNNANLPASSSNQRRKERPIQPKSIVTVAQNLVVASDQNVKQTQLQLTNKTLENALPTLIHNQQLVENRPTQNTSSQKSPRKRKISSTSQNKNAKKQAKDARVDFNNNNVLLNEPNSLKSSAQTQRKPRQKRTKTKEKESLIREEKIDSQYDKVNEKKCELKSNSNLKKNTKQTVKGKKQLEKNPTRRRKTRRSTKSTSLTQFSQTIFGKMSCIVHRSVFRVDDLKYEPAASYPSYHSNFNLSKNLPLLIFIT